MIFETDRLIVRQLHESDKRAYFDMMGNPNVMSLIPRKIMSKDESDKHLAQFIKNNAQQISTKVWAIQLKAENEFIGLCAFLKNNENEDEIGYRLRENYWGVGYGTEITKGLIDFGFKHLNTDLITADVYVDNLRSIKILEKFFSRDIEFFNTEDQCTDRRYKLTRKEWL
ncbi:MAG: GNAT family N-acetyltransferase [Crocinitomicaceae bacterium]|nr:GNAT family N-acetyltransferase [Crocinitomicaceae bacterium]